MRYLFQVLLLVSVSNLCGQKQGNIWMFGEGGALDFNMGTPSAFSGSPIFGSPEQSGHYLYSEGCASISDSSGNLLFYSNGMKVWNKLNQIMPNGNNLNGYYSSTSAAFIIPKPLSDSLYYLFTTDGLERYLGNGLQYSTINRCLDNGKGDVIESQKNILLLDTVSEKLCAIAHPNGIDIWLIAHKYLTNSFYAYLITPSGINAPIITNIGSVHTGNLSIFNGFGAAIGQMKASSDGTKIGLVFSNVTPSVAEIFDFNLTTGILSNVISLQTYGNEYGVEFSPDNTKLYTTSFGGIRQFDISSGNQATINSSVTQISSAVCLPASIQLGPDGKIYVTRCSNSLGVINAPNYLGTSCNYVNNSINISPASNNTSLPSFIAGYNYKNNKIPECSILSGIETTNLQSEIQLFPNPASETLTISLPENNPNTDCILFDNLGKELRRFVVTGGENLVDVSGLESGSYQLKIGKQLQKIFKH